MRRRACCVDHKSDAVDLFETKTQNAGEFANFVSHKRGFLK